MRRILLGAAVFFMCAVAASAQNFTTVTGTITDTNGLPYSNASVTAEIQPAGTNPAVPPPCAGQTSTNCGISGVQRGSADVNGTFSMTLASNAAIIPGGTQWKFTVTITPGIPPPAGTGSQSCTATVSISGASQSVTASFSACPRLSNSASGGGITGLTTGFIPKAASPTSLANSLCDEAITAANTITCTDTSGIAVVSAATGASPPVCTPGSGGATCYTEGTQPSTAAGVDNLSANSTTHTLNVNNNNTGEMPVSRTLCVNLTPVTVAASVTSDQNLQACSISANALNAVGHTLKVWTAGVFSTNAGSTAALTFKVKLCTVSGCGSGTVITPLNATTGATAALSATNLQFAESGLIATQTAGASSAYESQGTLTIDISATATVSESVYPAANTATVGTIDSTGALFIQVTAAASAASVNNSFTARQLIVELVN